MSGPTLLDALRACVAALAALEARPLLEPYALEVAIRERDDARAHVERLAHEVAASRNTIANYVHDLRVTRNAEDALAKRLVTAEARAKVLEGDAVPVAWLITLRSGHVYPSPHKMDVTNVVDAVEPLYRHPPPLAPPSGCVDHGPDGVGC